MENIVEMPTYSPALSLFQPVRTCTVSSWLSPSSYLRKYIMDGS